MASVCDYCSKGTQYGHTLQHRRGVAGGRWKRKAKKVNRTWSPNLHSARVMEDGVMVRRRLCTKCLRRARRATEEVKVAIEAQKKDKKTTSTSEEKESSKTSKKKK